MANVAPLGLAAALTAVLVVTGCAFGGGTPAGTPDVLLPPAPTTSPAALAASSTPAPTPDSQEPVDPPSMTPVDLPILMYHHVAPSAPSGRLQFNLTVTTADFCRQLDYLKASGYTAITLSDLFAALYRGVPLPQRPVVLTFDDGYADAFTDALPLLQRYGFRGAFAIVTGFVGGSGYLTWDQIKAMDTAGMEFAAHTVTHIDLNTAADDTARQELSDSRRALEERLGKPPQFFVYPSGEPFRSGPPERQQAVIALLREAGYAGALLAGPPSLTQDPQRPYELNRVRVYGGETLAEFAISVGGPAPSDAAAAACPP